MGCGGSRQKYVAKAPQAGSILREEMVEAQLRNYFQKDYKNGGAFDHQEYDFDVADWCWVHKGLKIKVWADALDLTQAGGDGDVECYFHYTTQLGFRNITHESKAAVEVFASLITSGEKANAWWGKGVYSVRKAPDEWPSVETLLDNNYRNMLKLAEVLRHRGDLAEAEALRRRVLEAEEAKLGGKHRNTLTALNNLAVVLWQQGKYEEAEALYCRALEGYEAQFGARHPVTLTSLNNLANLLEDRGKYQEAEPLYRKVLEGMEAQLGARHPDTLISVNNLGALLLDGGKVDESEVLLRRAVEGLEAQLGSQHPGTLRSVYHLARLRVAQGRLEDAESHFRRAMEGQVAQLGVRHQQTLDSISRLANLLEAKGSMEEAQELRSKGS
ncbi:Kinesin light chain 1 (KLC 1) [Durusdinium trenchii]|uniref:Kinesin light chain 1 (KLC 1) n=1 Tax=Durusdinium trenchii TaxID=1381693 RepID=A0ABP0RMX4_9DINO